MNRIEMLERLANGEAPLEVSIQKWQDIIDGIGEDYGADTCALCEQQANKCKPCIVFRTVGHGCFHTPYGRYAEDQSKENAQAELDFLKSLRVARGKTMNLQIADEVYNGEYTQVKKKYFEGQGKTDPMVIFMRANGISDDSIFIAILLGVYIGCLEIGLKI